MFNKKTLATVLALAIFFITISFAQGLEENWNDFLHYTKIGRLDLAKVYAQAVIDSNPDPVELLEFSLKNKQTTDVLLMVSQNSENVELAELGAKLADIIEQGKYIKRAEPGVIAEEVRRLTSNSRGYVKAVKRLKNAGEYAIPFMIDAIADDTRKEELPNVVRALPEIGKDAIRPLVAALQSQDVAVKAEIIKALGKIGYPQSLGYLKYVHENDSSQELKDLAAQSISQIDPSASSIPAADLFYRLGENYYYHAESLKPQEDADTANIWFWDDDKRTLVKEIVNRDVFYELTAMRCCEWALKADPTFGRAIGLWIAAYFKAEDNSLQVPAYFGDGHADAYTYATTAGPEYLHQALDRALRDKNTFIALGTIEALAANAGESSLLYRLGIAQPLVEALSFDNKAVKYSAAIAIAQAGPKTNFPESKLIIDNLIQSLSDDPADPQLANQWAKIDYQLRAAMVMAKLAQTRNKVIDLSAAQSALENATKSDRPEIKILASQTLAHFNSPSAQRAIAAMALDESIDPKLRIIAFNSLAMAAKINASLLDDATVDVIYELVSSKDIDPELRAAAASAYGALNLPSEKVKTLILDQAKS